MEKNRVIFYQKSYVASELYRTILWTRDSEPITRESDTDPCKLPVTRAAVLKFFSQKNLKEVLHPCTGLFAVRQRLSLNEKEHMRRFIA